MPGSTLTRLSNGPQHHFFGYYGICPWNRTNQYHLALQTDFHERAPELDDRATVGLIHGESGHFEPFAETRAFNLQQGSMLHWIDAGFGEECTFNDWEGDRLISRAINPQTGAQRTLDGAMAAVSPVEPIAIGLNFARMSACRRVVGYANTLYSPETLIAAPEDDGLFQIDLQTGRSTVLLSLADVQRAGRELVGEAGRLQPHWFNHVLFNTDGSRLIFLARIKLPADLPGSPANRRLDSLWMVNSDGGDLRCLIEYGQKVSHLAWLDADTVMLSCNVTGKMEFVLLDTRSGAITPMALPDFPHDGHNAFSPDYRWIACDTYPEGPRRERRLLLHDRHSGDTHTVASLPHAAHIDGDWRCDLHPRWSADGSILTFDSVHEGTRQIYSINVNAHMGDSLKLHDRVSKN